jgi:hypothetical protein
MYVSVRCPLRVIFGSRPEPGDDLLFLQQRTSVLAGKPALPTSKPLLRYFR